MLSGIKYSHRLICGVSEEMVKRVLDMECLLNREIFIIYHWTKKPDAMKILKQFLLYDWKKNHQQLSVVIIQFSSKSKASLIYSSDYFQNEAIFLNAEIRNSTNSL